ncbi:transmembrane protease serine 9 [Drosophila elegans]|uniref:transmembrane protease serine 9 n=1 Tax=Drosophila elegans TaxID=30023 RepID=UPI0007E605E4|nr:transmembrane protease serine 9 [Drosophila elegans]
MDVWTWLLLLNLLRVNVAKGLYDQCNHQVKLQSGQKLLINSPYYPALYPRGTSCRYAVEAPKDQVLQFKCELQLQTLSTDLKCRTEVFHFNSEGDEVLTSSEYFCGSGKFERKSFLNRAVISYISNGHSEPPSAVKLKDKLTAGATTSTTTHAPQGVSIEEQDAEEAEVEPGLPEESEDPEESEEDLSDEVLHVLQDVGVSDALAYVASLLYDDEEARKSRTTTIYLDALPIRSSSKTSGKRARIVTTYPLAPSTRQGGGRFTCLVEAIQPTCSCGWSRIPRIASPTNEEAVLHEFPPMAGVLTKKHGKLFCGAAIIHHHYLLSAAHCFLGPETSSAAQLRVVVGEHDLASAYETFATRRYDLVALILHEAFSQASDGQPRNDIALLKTRSPIMWSMNVGPACLPLQPTEDGRKLPLAGHQVVAAGWGTTSYGGPQTHRLLKATLDVIDGQRCRQTLLSAGGVPPHTFCTYTPGRDTCQYDSGGALYERIHGRLVAVGIVSFGQACATQQPSVNTRVASFIKWIRTKSPEVAYCPGRI